MQKTCLEMEQVFLLYLLFQSLCAAFMHRGADLF